MFSNATLADMVVKRPENMDEFLEVSGVGEYKAARYGKAFLKVIREWEENVHSQENHGGRYYDSCCCLCESGNLTP